VVVLGVSLQAGLSVLSGAPANQVNTQEPPPSVITQILPVEETPTAAEASQAPVRCEPHSSGLFCVYTVQTGDTVSAIAERFGIHSSGELTPAQIIAVSNKPHVADADDIAVGLNLRIPSENGIIHTVFGSSETVDSIAEKYGVDPATITAFAANNITDNSILDVGRELLVPNPTLVSDAEIPTAIAGISGSLEPDLEEESEAVLTEGPDGTEASGGGEGTGGIPEENRAETTDGTGPTKDAEGASGNVEGTTETSEVQQVPAETEATEREAGDGDASTAEGPEGTGDGNDQGAEEGRGEANPQDGTEGDAPETETPVVPETPVEEPAEVPPLMGPFVAGDHVFVVTSPGSCLNIREGPGLNHARTDCGWHGNEMTVVSGPVDADGHLWWQVESPSGWVAGEYLSLEAPVRVSWAGFAWPASGPLTSPFSPRHPKGIDIGLRHDPGQPVTATASGTVTFVGGDPCCSYGYYVIVDHGEGWSSLYGHFSSFAAGLRPGDHVDQGQVLGYGGTTGYSTGYHLHFEMRYNGSVVNPLDFLP
jgi:murein DD-endopeptidase MepM/ murein hydrolase activator NlpD